MHVVRGNAHHHAAATASVIGKSLEDNYQRWSDAIKWHKRDVKHQAHWSFGAPDTRAAAPRPRRPRASTGSARADRNLMEEAAEDDGDDDVEKCYAKSKRAHERQRELGAKLMDICRDEGLKVQCEAWTCLGELHTARAKLLKQEQADEGESEGGEDEALLAKLRVLNLKRKQESEELKAAAAYERALATTSKNGRRRPAGGAGRGAGVAPLPRGDRTPTSETSAWNRTAPRPRPHLDAISRLGSRDAKGAWRPNDTLTKGEHTAAKKLQGLNEYNLAVVLKNLHHFKRGRVVAHHSDGEVYPIDQKSAVELGLEALNHLASAGGTAEEKRESKRQNQHMIGTLYEKQGDLTRAAAHFGKGNDADAQAYNEQMARDAAQAKAKVDRLPAGCSTDSARATRSAPTR